jgi:predicted TIM-barrel enzyme
MYEVANKEQSDAIKMAGIATGSPGRNARIRVVAKAVRVMATFIPAAVHNTASCIGTVSGRI